MDPDPLLHYMDTVKKPDFCPLNFLNLTVLTLTVCMSSSNLIFLEYEFKTFCIQIQICLPGFKFTLLIREAAKKVII